MAAAFGASCLAAALQGFFALGDITDEAQRADARGFAWFWLFLGAVGFVLALAAWWLTRTARESPE